jgi:hypothetical protein
MSNRIRYLVSNIFRIRPEDNVPASVAKNFRHNAIINTLDVSFFFMADSFWNINTIMPVFAATLTDNPFLIGLMPAIVNAGWFLASNVYRLRHQIRGSCLSRSPGALLKDFYVLFPFLARLLSLISANLLPSSSSSCSQPGAASPAACLPCPGRRLWLALFPSAIVDASLVFHASLAKGLAFLGLLLAVSSSPI